MDKMELRGLKDGDEITQFCFHDRATKVFVCKIIEDEVHATCKNCSHIQVYNRPKGEK